MLLFAPYTNSSRISYYDAKRTVEQELNPKPQSFLHSLTVFTAVRPDSRERPRPLLLLLSQILVNYTYKFFYRNSVNHASLFQRLHLRRRASDAVHSGAH